MSRLTAKDLINDSLELVSLPDLIHRINLKVEDPDSSAVEIGQLIGEDPALTTRLLKVVNSPMFGFPSRIDTISMAITILGMRQLRDLVLATAVVGQFHTLTDEVVDMETFWCHSVCTGVAAKVIGQHLKDNNSERFFVAGLLHDIGKLVMYVTHPDASKQVIELADDKDLDKSSVEKSIFGFSHAEVGGELLSHWQLPESLIEPARYHHHPIRATRFATETAAVHIADTIANNIQSPISLDDDNPIEAITWPILGLESSLLEQIHEEVYEILDDSLKVLYYSQVA
ncbi:MAG: HDOD domain-containing protein [Gammaproteobacteria bacterium]|nr:HDOD domain-containing protein [Gammaproteobacteria bacterium]